MKAVWRKNDLFIEGEVVPRFTVFRKRVNRWNKYRGHFTSTWYFVIDVKTGQERVRKTLSEALDYAEARVDIIPIME